MSIKVRKLIGAMMLLLFLSCYALAAMLAAILLQTSESKIVELAYYIVAGLLWVVPAALIVRWMHHTPKLAQNGADENS